MRFPKFLNENGTIGFVAPSFGCNIEPYKSSFLNALERFKAMGYSVDLGPNCFKGDGIGISSSPENCGGELTEWYLNHGDVLISCGGGELMCETLDFVDFDRIKKAEPKWYMGYSDNTNFTFLLTTLCDVASIYAPCASTFGMEPWHESLHAAYNVLTGKNLTVNGYSHWEKEQIRNDENPLAPYNLTEPVKYKYSGTGDDEAAFSGRLIGGCLDCLINLVGTCYDKVSDFTEKYADDGIVWFLEACDLNVMSIRRALWELDHAGWFKNVKAFLIGRPLCFGQEILGLDQYSAVTGILGKYNVPMIMDCDIGHLSPMMPLVCGSYANVRAKNDCIEIDMRMM